MKPNDFMRQQLYKVALANLPKTVSDSVAHKIADTLMTKFLENRVNKASDLFLDAKEMGKKAK